MTNDPVEYLKKLIRENGGNPEDYDIPQIIAAGGTSIDLPNGTTLDIDIVGMTDPTDHMKIVALAGLRLVKIQEALIKDYERLKQIENKEERDSAAHDTLHLLIGALDSMVDVIEEMLPCMNDAPDGVTKH